ncbi:MAG: hypothetical protein ONB44_04705 [candidate division KSB1 bacterium]|nr:hypothetical protein [candidate division KSB1 bacterium]MDZ7301423.1 hypothetical protein [candidate division KSB1 bacterium]MDZ7313455.1 hypothetical protein [candidate division KSB1 bacterium]
MTRKMPPAKILVNRGVEFDKLRHPAEAFARKLNLVTAFLSLAGLIALTAIYPRVLIALYLVVALVIGMFWFIGRIVEVRLAGQHTRVSEKNFPEIHYIQTVVTQILPYRKPFRIYVVPNDNNAVKWRHFPGRRILLLPDNLVQSMIERPQIGQLLWLVGSRLALLRTRESGRLAMRWLLQLNRWNPVFRPLFNYYCRSTHYSADRIGLALNLSLIDAAEAMKKMAAGEQLHGRLNLDQVDQQAQELQKSFFGFCAELMAGAPALMKRFAQLVQFCQDHFPDLYADFEQHRQYGQALLPSYQEIQEFSEAKEEERKILRELGKVVFDLMSAKPPAGEADALSKAYAQLVRNRNAASELEGKIARLNAGKEEWEKNESKILACQQKQKTAASALEEQFKEIGRVAFQALLPEIPKHEALQQIFAKALQYHVVITDRQNEIARLEAATGTVLDKSKRQVEIISLRTQNANDSKRLQAAAEAVGEEFWKTCAHQFEHDDLEPIKLRIAGLGAELERRRVEMENLLAQKHEIESKLESEGVALTLHPDQQIPLFVQQLTTQARAANSLRPRLQEDLGKAYWQHEVRYAPETRAIVEQLNDLKRRIRAFEEEA